MLVAAVREHWGCRKNVRLDVCTRPKKIKKTQTLPVVYGRTLPHMLILQKNYTSSLAQNNGFTRRTIHDIDHLDPRSSLVQNLYCRYELLRRICAVRTVVQVQPRKK